MKQNQNYKNTPKHLVSIIELALQCDLQPKKVILYGSRARGDARDNSDFDLAFVIQNKKKWSDFKLQVHDNPPSVYKYDIVNYDECDEALKQSIDREGVVIYGTR